MLQAVQFTRSCLKPCPVLASRCAVLGVCGDLRQGAILFTTGCANPLPFTRVRATRDRMMDDPGWVCTRSGRRGGCFCTSRSQRVQQFRLVEPEGRFFKHPRTLNPHKSAGKVPSQQSGKDGSARRTRELGILRVSSGEFASQPYVVVLTAVSLADAIPPQTQQRWANNAARCLHSSLSLSKRLAPLLHDWRGCVFGHCSAERHLLLQRPAPLPG